MLIILIRKFQFIYIIYMVDTNSPEYQVGKKIGQAVMIYIGIRLVMKGTRMILKSAKYLLT